MTEHEWLKKIREAGIQSHYEVCKEPMINELVKKDLVEYTVSNNRCRLTKEGFSKLNLYDKESCGDGNCRICQNKRL